MAAEQMKKVTGHLSCPICYELYKKPKYLPCYHSYCEECLVKLVVQSNITCPECRKTTAVPSGGVHKLPNNFFINRLLDEVALKRKVEGEEEAKCDLCVRGDAVEVLCLDCSAFLCSRCVDNHKHSRDWQNHNLIPLNDLRAKKEEVTIKPKAKYAMCQKHELELNFYCETCDQLVCQYCIMKDHLKHDHDTVKEMAIKHRKELDKIMEPVEKMIEGFSVAYKKVSNTRDKIGAQADHIDKEIDRYYEELHRRLQQQRDELKKELHEASRQKKKEVTLQLEQMEDTQAQLESIKELNGAMKKGSDQETLLMKKQLVDDVKRISDSYNKLDTQPVQSATMEFIPVEEYKKSMPQFGDLICGNACSFNSEILDVPEMVCKGERVEFNVVTKDQSNVLCNKGGSKVIIHAQPSRGDITPVEIKDNKDGSYSASFVANQIGEVKLLVIIKGQQIKGSPFNVKVHRKYTAIKPSKVVDEGGRMGKPLGIAFGRDGMYAVGDYSHHCVWIFDRQDQLVKKFGTYGADNGQFQCPYGVAFDDNNHLYVADHSNHRVQKFDINGTYLLKFGTHGTGNGQLNYPLGITIHSGKVYVVEHSGYRISVFHCDGQFSHIVGSGYLRNPWYVAVSNDQLLVANPGVGYNCISMFTLDGNYVGKYDARGTGREQLDGPRGIATDMYGFIFVSEYSKDYISIFNKEGVFIHSFGSKSSGHGQFSGPRGIAISPTGDIYVCEENNKRIQIFST